MGASCVRPWLTHDVSGNLLGMMIKMRGIVAHTVRLTKWRLFDGVAFGKQVLSTSSEEIFSGKHDWYYEIQMRRAWHPSLGST